MLAIFNMAFAKIRIIDVLDFHIFDKDIKCTSDNGVKMQYFVVVRILKYYIMMIREGANHLRWLKCC